MKHLVLGFVLLFLASISTAQAQTDGDKLLTWSGAKVIAVEGATEVDLSTAKTLYERDVQFIDVRGSWYWKRGHIPDAPSLSYITEAKLMEIVDKNKEVVFYCDCAESASCNLSSKASAKAVALGYQNVYWFQNAEGWSEADYPIEKPE